MSRIFLAFLLVMLATLLIPSLRERAQPRIDSSREWLGQRLEGPLGPALTPYRTLRTQSRMGEVVRFLVRDRNAGQDPPSPGEFAGYSRGKGVEPVDWWGAPLILTQETDSLSIISAGPDREYHSDDDIINKIRYAAPEYRYFRRRR